MNYHENVLLVVAQLFCILIKSLLGQTQYVTSRTCRIPILFDSPLICDPGFIKFRMTFYIGSNHKNYYLKGTFIYKFITLLSMEYINWIQDENSIQPYQRATCNLVFYRSDKYASNNLVYEMYFEVIEIEQFQLLVLMKSSNNDDLSAVYLPNQQLFRLKSIN